MMKNKMMIHTNILISIIIVIGFATTSIISYNSNIGLYKDNIKHVSSLASDSLYNKIESIISKPLHVSLTMSDDTFLKDYLKADSTNQPGYGDSLAKYLDVYKTKYTYDTVFLISSLNNTFYLYDGSSHTISPDAPNDEWYYTFMESDSTLFLDVDPDLEDNGSTRIFINCKIKDTDGSTLGVIGIGFDIGQVQHILSKYGEEFQVSAYLTDSKGIIQLPYDSSLPQKPNILDQKKYASYDSLLSTDTTDLHGTWYNTGLDSGYVSARYLDNLGWNLVVSKSTDLMKHEFVRQLCTNAFVVVLILVAVIVIISKLVRHYNARIIQLTVSQELEYYRLLQNTTEALYEYLFEVNVTHNHGSGESIERFYQMLNLPGDTPFDDALELYANRYIKDEFAENYLRLFKHENVLNAYSKGLTYLTYDYLSKTGDESYQWIRLQAQLFFWNSDQSLHMIAYHQNIDEEKRRELNLIEKSQKDSLTGLYNKRATEDIIVNTLTTPGEHAFIIIDIDNFKYVNDHYGHAHGDALLQELSSEIKANFHAADITGRLGGDEFVILMKNYREIGVVRNKLEQLCARVRAKQVIDQTASNVSFSVGVALYPSHGTTYSELYEKADQALYYSKGHGKDTFTIYGDSFKGNTSYHVSQRDMDTLINSASDGIIKVALAPVPRLLYFNKKRLNLTNSPSDVLTAEDYNPFDQIHPEDKNRALSEIQAAHSAGAVFSTHYRLRKNDNTYVSVQLRGYFATELFENKYPIFYGLYEMME